MLDEAQSWAGGRRTARRGDPEALDQWRALVERYVEAVHARREAWGRWREAEELAALQAPPPDSLSYSFSVAGRRLKAWFEDEKSIRKSFAAGAIDAQRMQHLLEALKAWRQDRDAAHAQHRTDALRHDAEKCSDAADALRREIFATDAPDLDAVAYKLALLPQMIDDVWDFTDPKTLSEMQAGDLPDRETSAVMDIYCDVLRLNGRTATAERMRRKAAAGERAKTQRLS